MLRVECWAIIGLLLELAEMRHLNLEIGFASLFCPARLDSAPDLQKDGVGRSHE